MTGTIVTGDIDRISGSGNGMLRTGSDEYNLGPLPRDVVGNPAIAVPLNGTWAVCLTPYTNREKYLSEFSSTANRSIEDIKQTIEEVTSEQSVSSAVRSLVDNSVSGKLDSIKGGVDVGDSMEVEITIGGPNASYVFFADGTTIEVTVPYLPAEATTTIEIIESDGAFPRAGLHESVFENAPEPGTSLTVEVYATHGTDAYSIKDGVPIILPNCPASPGDTVYAGIESVQEDGLRATIDALPMDTRPEVGDILEIELDLPASNSTTTLIHDGIPIEITQPVRSVEGTLPIKITEIGENSVSAQVDFASWTGLSKGEEIVIGQLEQGSDRLVGKFEGTPVTVPSEKRIPKIPDSLAVSITEIRPDRITASIIPQPEVESLDISDAITVSIESRANGHLVGDYKGYPVWISFEISTTPSKLTVGITKISDSGIYASISGLQKADIPSKGEIVPVRINEADSEVLSGWIKDSENGVSFTLPVWLPISVGDSETVGVEIVGREESFLIGILHSQGTKNDSTQVSKYLLNTQRAVIAVREKRFEDAAAAWKAATDATESDIRRAEALRSWAFSSAQAVVSSQKSGVLDDDFFESIIEKLESFKVPDGYVSLVTREIEFYEELISIDLDEIPEGVEGLQRIAYTIDRKGKVENVCRKLGKDVIEQRGSVEITDWALLVPHPLLVYQLRRLCEELESSPETALPILQESSPSEVTRWSVPPVSSPDPSPSETIDWGSFAPDLSATTKIDSKKDPGESKIDAAKELEEVEHISVNKEPTESEDGPAQEAEVSGEEAPIEKSQSASGATYSPDTNSPEDNDRDSAISSQSDVAESTDEIGSEKTEELVTDRDIPQTTGRLRKLRREAEASASANPVRDTSSAGGGSRYQRAAAIKEYVKTRAGGICEACGEAAPFRTPDGEPYLETHHVDELGKGGEDHPDKVVAVCPTCHKQIHYGENGEELNEAIRERLKKGLADVGTN